MPGVPDIKLIRTDTFFFFFLLTGGRSPPYVERYTHLLYTI